MDDKQLVRMTIVPPGPCAEGVFVDIRSAFYNDSAERKKIKITLYLDTIEASSKLYCRDEAVGPDSWLYVRFNWLPKGRSGAHKIISQVCDGNDVFTKRTEIQIVPSSTRALRRIHGSWMSIVHWSEVEAKYWQDDIKNLTDDQWRMMIRGMHELDMNILVIQEVFRNQQYIDAHHIERDGYHGKAFYPSALYPGRVEMTAKDPIETIFDEADKLGMHIFPGVGLYAWFDFTPASLKWHKEVATELWSRYGHHKSFYGWYISEETQGNLGPNKKHREYIVEFFREMKKILAEFSPDKPVMLAPNCHDLKSGYEYWPKLLENLDIVCPFGFHRMPKGDITGEEAANLLQDLCDKAGSHLWLDMEVFLFEKDFGTPLYPRPIEGVVSDMERFGNFEKILCYQYPGLMNAPWAEIKPGGDRTVKLFNDYKNFIENTGLSDVVDSVK